MSIQKDELQKLWLECVIQNYNVLVQSIKRIVISKIQIQGTHKGIHSYVYLYVSFIHVHTWSVRHNYNTYVNTNDIIKDHIIESHSITWFRAWKRLCESPYGNRHWGIFFSELFNNTTGYTWKNPYISIHSYITIIRI